MGLAVQWAGDPDLPNLPAEGHRPPESLRGLADGQGSGSSVVVFIVPGLDLCFF